MFNAFVRKISNVKYTTTYQWKRTEDTERVPHIQTWKFGQQER